MQIINKIKIIMMYYTLTGQEFRNTGHFDNFSTIKGIPGYGHKLRHVWHP